MPTAPDKLGAGGSEPNASEQKANATKKSAAIYFELRHFMVIFL
jgi:hypothetical protein